MSLKRFVFRIASFAKKDFRDDEDAVHSHGGTSRTSFRGGICFLLLSILSMLFFVAFGIYEVLFRSPINVWFQSVWQSILKTSPQTLIQIPNQIVGSNNLMEKNVGDWLGFIPGSFNQLWEIVCSPASAILGLLIVFVAVVIRLGGKFINNKTVASNGYLAKIISWLTLGSSFVPLLLEYSI